VLTLASENCCKGAGDGQLVPLVVNEM
jgi:hypothetical protein